MNSPNFECISHVSYFFIYSLTDEPVSCLQNIKIYITIYIKTAPTCFGVTVTTSSGRALFVLTEVTVVKKIWVYIIKYTFPDDGVTVTSKHVGAVLM